MRVAWSIVIPEPAPGCFKAGADSRRLHHKASSIRRITARSSAPATAWSGRPPSAPRSTARIGGAPTGPCQAVQPSLFDRARSSTWPPGQEIPFDRQLADLGVKLGRLALALLLAIARTARPARKQARRILVSSGPRMLDQNPIGQTRHLQFGTPIRDQRHCRDGRHSLPCWGDGAFGKRRFAARDSRPHSASEGGHTCQIATADRNLRR